MSDLTPTAAEIIAQAVLGQTGWFDGHMLLATLDGWDGSDEEVGQLALAALAAAGFAVVQLPEPGQPQAVSRGRLGTPFTVGEYTAFSFDAGVWDLEYQHTREGAIQFASCLLAAAVSGANK